MTSVVIGLQHTFYSATEGQGSLDMCTVVISGDITGGSVEAIVKVYTKRGVMEQTCV